MLPPPVPVPSAIPPRSNLSRVAVPADDRAVRGLIEELIDRAGVPPSVICDRLGVSKQAVSQYRTLRRKRPSIQWLARLVAACGAQIYVEFPKGTL